MKTTGRVRFLYMTVMFICLSVLSVDTVRAATSVKRVQVTLDKRAITLYYNDVSKKSAVLKPRIQGTAKTIKWTTSDRSVATVSQKGRVTAKKVGTAIITVRVNGRSAKCTVKVKRKDVNYAKVGIYIKEYKVPPSYTGVFAGPSDSLIVQSISGDKIRFSVGHGGINASPLYDTGVITATIKNNKVSSFRWKNDGWGNKGTGSLIFGKNKVTVKMKVTKRSSDNRWMWWDSITLPYKKH